MSSAMCADTDTVIKEIEKYLSEFRSADLIEGAKVRDAFLDLWSLIQSSGEGRDGSSV